MTLINYKRFNGTQGIRLLAAISCHRRGHRHGNQLGVQLEVILIMLILVSNMNTH